jgi:hypothetical protein
MAQGKYPPGPPMTLGNMKKLVISLTSLTFLVISASANAEDCFKVDDEKSPAATLSGRITTNALKIPRNIEGRAAESFYLNLDTPLRVDSGTGCTDWRAIPVMDFKNQIVRWQNQHVTISGKLNRFGSALVYPPIFIEVTTIRGKQ